MGFILLRTAGQINSPLRLITGKGGCKQRSAVTFVTAVSGKNTTQDSTELLPESLLVTNDTLIKFPAPLSSVEETALKPVYFYKHKYCKPKSRDTSFWVCFQTNGLLWLLGS